MTEESLDSCREQLTSSYLGRHDLRSLQLSPRYVLVSGEQRSRGGAMA